MFVQLVGGLRGWGNEGHGVFFGQFLCSVRDRNKVM